MVDFKAITRLDNVSRESQLRLTMNENMNIVQPILREEAGDEEENLYLVSSILLQKKTERNHDQLRVHHCQRKFNCSVKKESQIVFIVTD